LGYIHFFDDWQLMSYQNLQRKMGKPKYVPEATLEDSLTEGTWNFPLVTRLPENGKYVGLYGAACDIPSCSKHVNGFKPRTQVLCYAESNDGINWVKPDLRDKAAFDGHVYAPNQVFGLEKIIDGGPVYFDSYDPDSSRRFKYLINITPGLHMVGQRGLVTSQDGIHWELSNVFDHLPATDTPSSVFYNPQAGVYVLNSRFVGGDRRVFFRETKDWKNFTEPYLVMHPDPEDPPLVGVYGMPVVRYENIFVGLLWLIYCDPGTNALPNGVIECYLAYSYDGRNFNRAFHKPLIAKNELGEHGGGCIYTSSMLIDENNTIRFYSGGSKAEHFQNQTLTDAALMLHTMRLDGFVYFSTPSGKGSLITRPFFITGDDLRINVRTPWGGVRVRILDEKGKPLPGFGYEDCASMTGDQLFWTPRWKGGTFGSVKSSKRRQLEIEIVTGEIYGIRGDFEIPKSLWNT
jgi:hypothetical protein